MMFALVRVKTEGRLQPGLTFILIDMHDPRVSIRPIITIDGRHHINEVSLDGVRVPLGNVVGEVGRGWRNARFLLASERVLLAQAPWTRQGLADVKRLAALRKRDGRGLRNDPSFQRRLMQAEIDLCALEATILRVLYASPNDPVVSGLSCVLKLRGAELKQRLGDLAMEALGDRALISYPDRDTIGQAAPGSEYASAVAKEYLMSLSATIAGGTSEIQRNLIAAVSLGL
jgi:alkylation response protein AidB-like acyl-CoA dehydrogenase